MSVDAYQGGGSELPRAESPNPVLPRVTVIGRMKTKYLAASTLVLGTALVTAGGITVTAAAVGIDTPKH
jgi:hypothetical protein